jgi:hypothetical protein
MNLLYGYITQGRVEADRPHLSPRRVTRLLLPQQPARPGQLQALLPRPAHQLDRRRLLSTWPRLLFPRSHVIQCGRHLGTFPARPSRPGQIRAGTPLVR